MRMRRCFALVTFLLAAQVWGHLGVELRRGRFSDFPVDALSAYRPPLENNCLFYIN